MQSTGEEATDSQEGKSEDAKKGHLARKLLAESCEREGLDAEYWLPRLSDILGVRSREALKHLQYEDYLKLECKVEHPWEKKALQQLLEITDKKRTIEELQKKRLEMTKKKQEAARLALNELKEMYNSNSHTKEFIRKKGEALWKALDIPQEYWTLSEKTSVEVLERIQKQLEQEEESVCRSENVSDKEVLRRASGGLALQGIYRTNSLPDMLAKREQLINIPDGFKLDGPEQGSLLEKKEFSSSAAEATFTKSMQQLGFSISVAAEAGFWKLSVAAAVDHSSSSQSEETHKSCSEQAYICTTKYQYIPLASCYFQKHQLHLSDVALQELQGIEQLLSITPEANRLNMLKSRCGNFFSRFGSHINQGPLHFGGIFWWKASTEGFKAEQREEMKRQASEALNRYIGATFYVSPAVSVDTSKSSSEASFQGRDRRDAQTAIQLFVTKTGGPSEVDSLAQWKSALVTSNTTWSVIDRGFQLIPVWDIVLANHSNDFKSVYQMSSSLRTAYEALTNHNVSVLFGEELVSAVEEARAFLEGVKAWEVTVDENKLFTLIDFKQHLNEKMKNHSVWIHVCLSDKALQEFLVNTVLSCQKSSSENTTYIKSLLQCLLDPHVYSVKDFPRASFIMQWIFHTERTIPETPNISEFEDLTKTLLQMKEYIQEVTYAPEASASAIHEAKIKATLTISLSVNSLLRFLRDRVQKDLELLVLLVTTSTGYQVESSTFQHLLGCPEINFMIKEMEMAHKEYLNLKDQDVYRAQAFLLLTGLTVTPKYKELSLEQKYDRLVVMKDQMKNSWSTEIKTLLEKHDAYKDWEMLERDLHSFTNGRLDDTCSDLKQHNIIKDMEDTFQEIKPSSQSISKSQQKSCSESKRNEEIANQEFLNLLRRLGLESYYPRKMGTEDFHLIHTTSLHDSQPSKNNELPFYFLQKLLTVDYRVRYIVCKDDSNQEVTRITKIPENEHEPPDTFDDFFTDFGEASNESANRESHVHPMDLQMAIFHCANDFMRQYLATKLAFCQFALPLLVPDPCTSRIEFPLWSLSQIKKSWKGKAKLGKQTTIKSHKNKLIYQAETPIVSFIRIGSSPSSSKSQILNALLSKHRHDTFFHRHCKGSTKDCLLMKGVVEISWYCPSGSADDTFDYCVAFCNLHGDARDHEPQLQFLQEISSVNVALLSESEQSDKKGMKILHDLWQSQKPLICLFTEKENVAPGRSGRNRKIGIKNRNEAELIGELIETIRDLLAGSNNLLSLDACQDVARQHGFVVDEDAEECVTAKAKAKTLVQLLKKEKLSEIKLQLLPLQGKLWYTWCKKDKELTRLQEKRNKSIEHHRSQIESEKSAIRRKQLDRAFPLNQLMKSVLGFLQSQSEDTKKYFLQWMKIFMDDLSSDRLDELRKEYHQLWYQILAMKKSNEKKNLKTLLLDKLEALSKEINDSSIGLEHILREVGQIHEALESMNSKDKCFVKLPEIAADLMVSGYPIELMDGDASYVPMRWVGAIFDRLIEKLGDKRVYVLSVLGIQSTGKSTLLNAMFGLQFNVSAGRCTRGAIMQLLKVDENLRQDVNFDYMLIVDAEGLRAVEMANKQSLNHDNELATFVIGIGNMTLINIFGENPSEMQDVLQIAVQAFLRMKQVHLSPSCLFVHQNVGEITAKEQNMEGQRRLQEKLDEMTVIAAQQEFCDVTCFSEVIRFDVNTHIHYFAHLWEGNPPMAPPNPTYSQNVQELKSKILQAAKKESQSSILRLSSLKVRISDLWNALLNENFIFSFKNSVEIATYKKLETAFSQWTWQLRSHILDLQMKLDNRIRNGELQVVTREYLEKLMQEKYNAIMTDLEKYFSEDKDCDILVQWKSNTDLKLKETKESLLAETSRKCEKLIELKKNQGKLDERKSKYENELLKRSRELALSLKGQKLSGKELRENFDGLWAIFVTEMSSAALPPEQVNIDVDIEDVLLDYFKEPNLAARMEIFSEEHKFSVDLKKHIIKKKSWGMWSTSLDDAELNNIHRITHNITEHVGANIDKKEKDKMDYSRNFIYEILNEVEKGINSVPNNAKYSLNKDYRIDLSLYLCGMAAQRFKDMHAAFKKANDPVIYLESKREDFFKCFQISCEGATSITTFSDFLCNKISPALCQAVYGKTALVIAQDMKMKIPDFGGNRSQLEACILKYLAQEENFEKFSHYLHFPKDFFEEYIKERVDEYCLDKNRRLEMFLKDSLTHYYENIQSAVFTSTRVVKDRNDRKDKISLWLDEFCNTLGDVLNLPRKDLKGIEHLKLTDIEFLKNAMTEALAPLRDELEQGFANADMSSFERQPHTILAEQFAGCWEQCPFCGAVCTNMCKHDGDHQLPFHRPQALIGYRWFKTDNLVIDICSSSVASKCLFKIGEDTYFPFRKYRNAGHPYSTWKILPDSSMQAYWKWFVCHFRTQLEQQHNGKFQGKGEIPDSWERITKQEAISELDKF